MPHDWTREIVGYEPQSEPEWVTSFGYRPPIEKHTCKNCGKTFTASRGWIYLTLTELNEQPCIPKAT